MSIAAWCVTFFLLGALLGTSLFISYLYWMKKHDYIMYDLTDKFMKTFKLEPTDKTQMNN